MSNEGCRAGLESIGRCDAYASRAISRPTAVAGSVGGPATAVCTPPSLRPRLCAPSATPTCPIARQVWPNSQKWRSLQISRLGRQASRIVVEADRHRDENLSHLVASDPTDGSEQHLQTVLDVAVSSPLTAWNQIAHELPNANRRLPKSDTLW